MEIARANMPDGYRVVASGSARTFRESFASLFFAMILGLIVAYMVLASQFNAFTHPFTVLLALPFSVSGALVALFLADAATTAAVGTPRSSRRVIVVGESLVWRVERTRWPVSAAWTA